MTTRIDIINRALIDIGQTPVQDDTNPPGDSYALQYETHIGALVSSYPWTFQTRLAKLARLVAPPELHWAYAFDLPSDMNGAPRAAYPSGACRQPTTDYEIRGKKLYTNFPEIWLRFTTTINPALWPLYFTALAVLVMKAQFALSIREDTALWRTLTEMAFGAPQMMGEGGKLAEAKNIDASGKPSDVIPIGINPLTSVRLS